MIDASVLLITAASFLAAFVNAAFATGGIYILLLGSVSVLPISAAVPLQSAFACSSLIARVWMFWAHINWRIVRMFVLGCLFGVYFGTLTFVSIPENTIAILLGIVLLVLTWSPTPQRSLPIKHPFFFVGIVHSFLGAIFGVGGVLQPLLLRTKALKMEITGTLAGCMLALDALKVTGYVGFGFSYFDYVPHIIGATLAGFPGSWLGKRVTHQISEAQFRAVFRALITLVALRLIYKGLFP